MEDGLARPDYAFIRGAAVEEEDRANGNFPYDDPSVPGITDFYAGKDVFITGGTGFVGKVLIEKMLRSLPEGGRIFLLMRGRKGLSAQQRLKAMQDLPLFKVVMAENPGAVERLVAIEGDCGSLGLGMSPEDRKTVVENVSVVFHCAATVLFDKTTSHMILVNTRGTREVVRLCKELARLESLVCVSTAYCNATKDRNTPIPEEILRQDLDWRTLITIAENTAHDPATNTVLDRIFGKMTTKHQNNYTFTKALAEDVLDDEARNLPVIIVRPTMVVGAHAEPLSGWIDNLYGPIGLWDGILRGIVRVCYCEEDIGVDYIPVDVCVKTLLLAGWHRGTGFRTSFDSEKVDVVNAAFGEAYNAKTRKIAEVSRNSIKESTHKFIFRYPRALMTNSFWAFWLVTVTSHLPLGILVDTALRLKGRKPRLMTIYRRLYFAQTNLLHFFASKPFIFDLDWQWKLQARIRGDEDKRRFNWIERVNMKQYCIDLMAGIKKYVYNEEPCKPEQSNLKIMWYLDWVHNALLAILGWYLISWILAFRNY